MDIYYVILYRSYHIEGTEYELIKLLKIYSVMKIAELHCLKALAVPKSCGYGSATLILTRCLIPKNTLQLQ
jgi:hypothetical protein